MSDPPTRDPGPSSDRVGEVLGRYRVESLLGRGGMAEVYVAADDTLGRKVAVKVISARHAADDEHRARFLREARTVAALDHPHILPIYDCGTAGEDPYLVMPLVEGGTLADRLAAGPLPPHLAAAWTWQVAGALDAAHRAGVLHRDVKPGNVLVGAEDRLLLADFGIARLTEATTRLTATGTIVGTPLYMAPEVAAGEKASEASDRYSLAVLAYEMLRGSPPFDGDNMLSILHQHATRPVPPITPHVPGLPPDVDGALERGLRKESGERPSSCLAFADSLVAALPARGDEVGEAETLPLPAGRPPAGDGAQPEKTTAEANAPRNARWLVAAVVLVLAVAGLWLVVGDGDSPADRPPADRSPADLKAPVEDIRPEAEAGPETEDAQGSVASPAPPESSVSADEDGQASSSVPLPATPEALVEHFESLFRTAGTDTVRREAEAAFEQLSAGADAGDAGRAAVAAFFAGRGALVDGDLETAMDWFRRALATVGPEGRERVLSGVLESLRNARHPLAARRLLLRACRDGFEPACQELRSERDGPRRHRPGG